MTATHKSIIPVLLDSEGERMSQIMAMINSIQKTAGKKNLPVKIFLENEILQSLSDDIRTIIVIGIASAKMHLLLEKLWSASKRIIIINFDPDYIDARYSCVTFSRRLATEQIMDYLYQRGSRHFALIGCGVGSANDELHVQTMQEHVKQYQNASGTSFRYQKSITESFDAFFAKRHEFDTVLSVNPYVAVAFLRYCEDHNIQIPDDYLLACIRDSYICRYCKPSITTLSENSSMIGEQAVAAWQYLENTVSDDVRIRIDVRGNVIERDSTSKANSLQEHNSMMINKQITYEGGPFYQDKIVTQLISLEKCLYQCDELDFRIINLLIQGETNERISEKLFISISALQYRMNKYYQTTNTSNKNQFVQIITDYFTHQYQFT